jgi:ADP-heptose:LPS heptosyltransferase
MQELNRHTLIICDCKNYGQAINALRKSLLEIKPHRTIFFTDIELPNLPAGVELIKIAPIGSKEEYSKWICCELYKYIDTEFVLTIQWDGHVLNGDSWSDEFYEYDWVGAAWLEIDGYNVGNGAMSHRSQRLMEAVATDELVVSYHPEDNQICRLYRPYLEAKYGFRWATDEIADKFAYELRCPIHKTFGFHSFFHQPYQDTIVLTRSGAAGDVLACEPVLRYYYEKGYRVVLNTQVQHFNLFRQHYFKIHHPDELDKRLPYKEFNLDYAYEVFPKQLHLQSYYDICGIKDGPIRNPKLTLSFDAKITGNKFFRKYCLIHNDRRLQAERNIYGIDWGIVVNLLNDAGYEVVQIGVQDHDEIPGAVQFNCPTELMLMWLIGGADLFIGVDSLPSNIAVAMNTPAIICFGSVRPGNIIPDITNVMPIHNHHKKICETAFCWENSISQRGTKCYISEEKPPCTQFHENQIIDAIDKIISK